METPRQSILAVHPGALGDVVLFGHLLRAMEGDVVLAAGGEKARLLNGLGVVRKALDFDLLPMHEVFSSQPLQRRRLPGLLGPCERLVSCFAAGNAAAEGRLSALAGAARADFLPVRPSADFDGHLVEFWSRQLGMKPRALPVPWPVPRAWREDARRSLRDLRVADTAPYWVIHPGAGAQRKCWPLERFLQLAGHPPAAPLGQAVFVLGPVEQERWAGVAQDLGRRFPLLLCPPLATLAGLLAGASAYVGNDSGVTHLSAAVGTATVALFQRPSDRQFSPLGRRVSVVSAPRLADIPVEKAMAGLG